MKTAVGGHKNTNHVQQSPANILLKHEDCTLLPSPQHKLKCVNEAEHPLPPGCWWGGRQTATLPQGLPRDPSLGLGITLLKWSMLSPLLHRDLPSWASSRHWVSEYGHGLVESYLSMVLHWEPGCGCKEGRARWKLAASLTGLRGQCRAAGHRVPDSTAPPRLSWAAGVRHRLQTKIYCLSAVLTLSSTFFGNPGLSLQKQSRLLQQKTAYGFYPPLSIYKGDPDHQLLFIMEKTKT